MRNCLGLLLCAGLMISDAYAAVFSVTVTLTASPNPSALGGSVMLSATVSPSTAPGKVTFYDGAGVLGVSSVVGGVATLRTSLLPAGSRSLRALYPGSGSTYSASTSNVIAQTVTAQAANSFLSSSYAAGVRHGSVAVGDFNGDGKADLVVTNPADNSLSVLLANANGTFQSPVSYAVGINPRSVVVGDFNGDGKADLATDNMILYGNGDGTFQAPTITYMAVSEPISLAVADFNGDGLAELVWVTGESVASGDFNGDGKADLAVVLNADSGGPNLSILLGKGDGTFQAPVNYTLGKYPGSISVAVADFNGDGTADIAVANFYDNSVSVLLGNGDGTFQPAMNYGAGISPHAVAAGDFNGDGKIDLAVANANGDDVTILLGHGDGTFQLRANYAAGVGPSALAVGDFNGDGRTDLAVANFGSSSSSVLGSVSVLTGASGSLSISGRVTVGGFHAVGLPVRLNGSQTATAVTDGNGNYIFTNLPAGNNYIVTPVKAGYVFSPPSQTFSNLGGSLTGVVFAGSPIGDINGDGKTDLFLYDPAGNGYAALSDGSGGFSYVYTSLPPGLDTMLLADINADGRADLAVANSSTGPGLGYIGIGNGNGTFNFSSLFWGGGYRHVRSGDLNGDGKSDFIIAGMTDFRSTGVTHVWTGISDGAGGFTYKDSSVRRSYYTHTLVGDFNGDGKVDVLLYDDYSGLLGISDGAGGLTYSSIDLGAGYDRLDVGDINGDGKADVLLYSSTTGAAKIGISYGAGFVFSTYTWSPGFTAARLFDWNGDGKADLLLYNKNNTLGYLGVGSGTGSFNFGSVFWGPGMEPVAVGDLNGDGKQDFVIHNTANGAAYTCLSTGNAMSPFTFKYSYWGNGKVVAQ